MNTKKFRLATSDLLKGAFAKKNLGLTPSAKIGDSQPPSLVTEQYPANRKTSVKELNDLWGRTVGGIGSNSWTRWRKIAVTIGGVLLIFLLLCAGELLTDGYAPTYLPIFSRRAWLVGP